MAAIAKNVKKWQPSFQPKAEGEDGEGKKGKESPPLDANADLLSFEAFDINQVATSTTLWNDCEQDWSSICVMGLHS